jgi:hypothetical protein
LGAVFVVFIFLQLQKYGRVSRRNGTDYRGRSRRLVSVDQC